jgi:hypothetical protein
MKLRFSALQLPVPDEVLKDQIAFPSHTQVTLVEKNPSYWRSLWVGVSAPIINLPFLLWGMVVLPFLMGLLNVLMFILFTAFMGIRGKIAGIKPTQSDLVNMMMASKIQAVYEAMVQQQAEEDAAARAAEQKKSAAEPATDTGSSARSD